MPGKAYTPTSPAANRSGGSNSSPTVVYWEDKDKNPNVTIGPRPDQELSGILQIATTKGNYPLLKDGYYPGAGASNFLRLKSTPYGPASPSKDLIFINKPVRIKVDGKLLTYQGYFMKKSVAEARASRPPGGGGGGGGGGGTSPAAYVTPGKPEQYNWNLPPHKWSLPTLPTVVNKEHYTEATNFTTVRRPGSKANTSPRQVSSDKYRRGRLWWKANPDIAVIDKDKTTKNISSGSKGRQYGFQFLWNPETFGTQVAVQMEATPSPQDRFLGVAGAFPATQTISFTVRIDRTNDFACAAAKIKRPTDINRTASAAANYITKDSVSEFVKYYINNGAFNTGAGKEDAIKEKLVDLLQRGTIADIEYLYKTINGPGPSSNVSWTNGRGVKTSDIGFLMPTLLHIDIGPLSYEGYVTNLSVNHIMFTPDMVPIRSDVSISLNLLATATLSTAV